MRLTLEEFATCCRCCLSTNVKTQPLFGASLGEMLQSVVSLEVKESDHYPQQICTRCIIKLSTSFNFCQSVKTSYQTLKGILEKSIQLENIPISNSSGDYNNALEDVKQMLPSNEELDTISNTIPDNLFIGFDDTSISKLDEDTITTKHDIGANEELFHCSHCTKNFQNKREMEIHLRLDHKTICSECGKSISVLGMPRHLQTHNKMNLYICPNCGRPFADRSNLSKHMQTHTGTLRNANRQRHLCQFCGKLFRWRTSLCRHRRIHTNINLVTCIVCFKKFGDQYTLNTHMASHTATKSFKCDICDRGFTQLCNLKKHKQTHTDERPHKCPHCNRGFRQKCVMLLHIRKHTGEKPYTCPKCQRCFACDLKQLLNIIFICMQCNENFSSNELYKEHLKVHKDE